MGTSLGKLFVAVSVQSVHHDCPTGEIVQGVNQSQAFDQYFVPDNGFGFFQLLFLGAVYAYILFQSSNMISEGDLRLRSLSCD